MGDAPLGMELFSRKHLPRQMSERPNRPQIIAGAVGAAAIFVTAVIYYALSSRYKDHHFTELRGIRLYHTWNFFQRLYDFNRISSETSDRVALFTIISSP